MNQTIKKIMQVIYMILILGFIQSFLLGDLIKANSSTVIYFEYVFDSILVFLVCLQFFCIVNVLISKEKNKLTLVLLLLFLNIYAMFYYLFIKDIDDRKKILLSFAMSLIVAFYIIMIPIFMFNLFTSFIFVELAFLSIILVSFMIHYILKISNADIIVSRKIIYFLMILFIPYIMLPYLFYSNKLGSK